MLTLPTGISKGITEKLDNGDEAVKAKYEFNIVEEKKMCIPERITGRK